MKKIILAALVLSSSLAFTNAAFAEGCLKGAAVGGVGGHFVGSGHAVLGAAGGCLVGRHIAKKNHEKEVAAQRNQQYQQNQVNR